ncbi:hypothetical protein [Mycobacterium tuberculosis]|nr:hypothetical protein [Mycobacterium tuberculosis]
MIGLTRHGALRWAKNGIRVNAVCPRRDRNADDCAADRQSRHEEDTR